MKSSDLSIWRGTALVAPVAWVWVEDNAPPLQSPDFRAEQGPTLLTGSFFF